MYREELVEEIKMCTNSEKRGELLSELFFANLGLTVTLCNRFSSNSSCRDDLMQLAYLALDKAVTAYDERKGFSILSNYRMCFKHECYSFWLKSGAGMEVCYDSVNTCFDNHQKYNKLKMMFNRVEIDFMNRLLWECVTDILSKQDSTILKMRFIKKQTLKIISSNYGMTIEGVRRRIKRSCQILHDDRRIQEIAKYYDY